MQQQPKHIVLPKQSGLEADWAIYFDLLCRWQRVINLVAPSTLKIARARHFEDSVQILSLVPYAEKWVDLGSGAGFPGLVTALQLKQRPGARVHLIESDQRKCAFLREVSRETCAPTTIHCGRVEDILPRIKDEIQAVSARALAPLANLLQLSTPLLSRGAVGVFPKGQDVAEELTEAAIDSRFVIQLVQSKTDARAKIVLVKSAKCGID